MAQHDLFLPSFTHRKPGLQCDSDERTGNGEVDPVEKRVGGWSHEYRKRFSLSVRSVYYLLEQCWLMRAGREKGDSAYTLVAFQTSLLFAYVYRV